MDTTIRDFVSVSILFYILFLVPGHTGAQILDDPYFLEIDDVIFRDNLFSSRNAGAGMLKFIVPDTLRDPFVNPAKIYEDNDILFIAPYNRFFTIKSQFDESRDGTQNRAEEFNSRNRTHFLPVGGIFSFNGFHVGGSIAHYDYFERSEFIQKSQTINDSTTSEARWTGKPVTLIAAYRSKNNWKFGLSYERSRITAGLNNGFISARSVDSKRITDIAKLGWSNRLSGSTLNLLMAGYRYKEVNSSGDVSDEDGFIGILGQVEYLKMISEQTRVGGRFTFDHKDYNERFIAPFTDGQREDLGWSNSIQAGLGASNNIDPVTLSAEAEFEYSRFKLDPEDNENGFTLDRWRYQFRTGIEYKLSARFTGQFGVSYRRDITNLSIRSVVRLLGETLSFVERLHPISGTNRFRLTAGLLYTGRNISLNYAFNYANEPRRLFIRGFDQQRLTDPIINQITLKYRL